MTRLLLRTFFAVSFLLCPLVAGAERPPQAAGDVSPAIDVAGFDRETRPQDDFFRFVNGGWLDQATIPADRSRVGSFMDLADKAEADVKRIVEEVAAKPGEISPDNAKIRDTFNSFMDEARIESLGTKPIAAELERIAALKDKKQVVKHMARAGREGISGSMGFWVGQDGKEPTRNVVQFAQTGLGLPSKDNYFDTDKRSQKVRAHYRTYIARLFELAGEKDATRQAEQVIALETKIAKLHWSRAESRDRDKTYNKLTRAQFEALHPLFSTYLKESGIGQQRALIVAQPSYYKGLAKLIDGVSVAQWRSYLRYKTLKHFAPYLTKAFRAASFEFHGRTLAGLKQPQERWKAGIGLVDGVLGEAVGREYVARHFPAQAKDRMTELVNNLKGAMREVINELDWMDPKTKREAFRKLKRSVAKLGHPDKWQDFSGLEVRPGDLVGNVRRAARFGHREALAKLSKPVDRGEWHMTPQTVNAYYHPSLNEVVFPAAILQPPFFHLHADDAVNYGAIGMVIGHELGHGFDDQGRKVDAEGKLRDWWTARDAAEFNRRADKLVAQFDKYEPLPGAKVNGRLTLGENIADLLGMTVAYRAYRRSLAGKRAPKLQGFTGKQRFFLSYGQIWRGKARDEHLRQQVATDPHSPPQYRVNGVLENFAPFHRVWRTRKHEGEMYKQPRQRVRIW